MIHPDRLAGRYTFAAGEPLPKDASPTFVSGYLEAQGHRDGTGLGTGRDCAGHGPPPPHLCGRDVRKVCNCCITCQRNCVLPKYPPRRGLLDRAAGAASTALARLLNGSHKTRGGV